MPRVSVVIPCYNQGEYLDEAVDSVLSQSCQDFEIIIVNDGSTDAVTKRILADFRKAKTRIINTENLGVAAARNAGIEEARGEYVLPLDADDAIEPRYLELAVAVMDNNPGIGIVYCLGELFGAEKRIISAPEFSIRKMLLSNLIFASALFRKEDWRLAGGYNPNMRLGCEDWDFWLSIIELGRMVYRIPEILFRYRIKGISRNTSMTRNMQMEMHLQLMKNHPALFIEQAAPLLSLYYRILGSGPYRLVKRIMRHLRIPASRGAAR